MRLSHLLSRRWWAAPDGASPGRAADGRSTPSNKRYPVPHQLVDGRPVGTRTDYPNWQVLLCYRRLDEPYCVGAMHDFLVDRFGSGRIFRDCRCLRPGEDYGKLIMDVVRKAHVVVVIIGSQWLSVASDTGNPALHDPNDWVRREIRLALQLHKHVLPVLLDGVEMPDARTLPKEIAGLSSLTAQSVSHQRLTEDLELLAERLVELVPTLLVGS